MSQHSLVKESHKTPIKKQGYTILLIDDDELILEMLECVLSSDHYNIVTCTHPNHALELIKNQTFHLIISDYMMPAMNGGELLKQARFIQPNSIRILITSHSDVNAVLEAVRAGAVYKFILKPWNDEDLKLTISLALQKYDLIEKNIDLQRDKVAKDKTIQQLAKFAHLNQNQLAIMLNKKGLLTNDALQELLRIQSHNKDTSIIKLIIEREWLTEAIIHKIMKEDLKLEPTNLNEYIIDSSVASLIPAVMCQQQLVLPLNIINKRLTLAMADPLDTGLIDNLRFVTGLDVIPMLATIRAIEEKIAAVYKIDTEDSYLKMALTPETEEGIDVTIEDEEDSIFLNNVYQGNEPPAIRIVNAIMLEAIRLNASDIHIQPRAKNVAVILRIDGVLVEKFNIPYSMHQSTVSRIKIMAELDISERRRPQDGRITLKTPKRIVDMRISTLPTINGEKVVMRILDRHSSVLNLDVLGFSQHDLDQIYEASDKPQGIILATGPTGSGKTTTLYSLLQHTASSDKSYVTIEDPVEYYLDTAGQVLVKEKIGLSFPIILRSILRQDPDVILIGEIRDYETAEVAFHAALTGHQVYSTLHTNSAFATLSRLFDLGLKPFVVSSALEAIIAQRLIRCVCKECSEKTQPDQGLLQRLKGQFSKAPLSTTYKGKGCEVCNQTGYKGRVGIYEVLVLDDHIRYLISQQTPLADIIRHAQGQGFRSLRDDAYDKVKQGISTIDEVYRVIGPG